MELASERLVLRPAELDDLDFYVELRNHPETVAGRRDPRPRSEVERQLRRWIEQWRELGFGAWTVIARGSSERLARVQLDPVGPGWTGIEPGEVEVGCIVHPAYWNRGIATEATQIAVDDFFGRVGGRRLVALSTLDNPASLRTLEKLGMRPCGETHGEGDPTSYLLFELVQPERPV